MNNSLEVGRTEKEGEAKRIGHMAEALLYNLKRFAWLKKNPACIPWCSLMSVTPTKASSEWGSVSFSVLLELGGRGRVSHSWYMWGGLMICKLN